MFSAGFVLGPVRLLFIVPRTGERVAELLEAPLMLAIIVVTARWMVRRFGLSKASDRLWVGVLGLALAVLFEIAVVLKLRGLTLTGYLSTRDPVSGTVYYLSLLIFAVIPMLFRPETAQDS